MSWGQFWGQFLGAVVLYVIAWAHGRAQGRAEGRKKALDERLRVVDDSIEAMRKGGGDASVK